MSLGILKDGQKEAWCGSRGMSEGRVLGDKIAEAEKDQILQGVLGLGK